MSKHSDYKLSALERQQGFLSWLSEQGETMESLGRRIQVTKSSLSRMYRRERLSTWRWNQLVGCGVPAKYLPPPEDRSPGPARRTQ